MWRCVLVQHGALVAQAAHKGNHLVLFQLLANHPEHFVTVFQVYSAGGGTKMAGNGVYNRILILQGTDVSFEDADHVPELNNFMQNSYAPASTAYIKRIIIYT